MADLLNTEFSAVTFIDDILHAALVQKASDIHVESTHQGINVRFRIDGILSHVQQITHADAYHVIARLKVLANLDVSERRLAQDGKFTFLAPHAAVDLRVATFPSLYGEHVVVRILDRCYDNFNSEKLGFFADMNQQFLKLINQSHGLVLVTGPTGAGKTTTLYSALSVINNHERHIITLEEPIEYSFEGITQAQIRPEIGFTFATALRSVLRQDPDIILVGEIRDYETAEIAVQAALTGHLVLSTLHTTDSPSAIIRLIDMGVRSFLINATVTGVLAQRLVRTLCTNCRYQTNTPQEYQAIAKRYDIALTFMYVAQGCAQCNNTGFRGRIGIFELLVLTHELKELITRRPSYTQLHDAAVKAGMRTLMHDGLLKVAQGLTSINELARVLG
ncbi:MAG: GspE/PulE family protein [Candidatus Babeliaceae bacterium]|nr:GspE/PulE family protein [Candidatus Babeliaceae bacterium]